MLLRDVCPECIFGFLWVVNISHQLCVNEMYALIQVAVDCLEFIALRWPCAADRTLQSNYYFFKLLINSLDLLVFGIISRLFRYITCYTLMKINSHVWLRGKLGMIHTHTHTLYLSIYIYIYSFIVITLVFCRSTDTKTNPSIIEENQSSWKVPCCRGKII